MIDIPVFYRVFFAWIDPLVAMMSASMTVFTPEAVMESAWPPEVAQYDHKYDPILQQLGVMFTMLAILSAGLPRISNDLNVHKLFQGAIFLVDVVIIASTLVNLQNQDKLAMSDWRSVDWTNMTITAICGITRAMFVLTVQPATGAKKAEARAKKGQ